jgi:hypothetical protein
MAADEGKEMVRGLLCAIAVFAISADGAVARDMYVCEGANGTKVFSESPCGTGSKAVRMREAPTVGDSPAIREAAAQALKEREAAAKAAAEAANRPREVFVAPTPEAYQCRVANGEVFYQHSRCPANVTVLTTSWLGSRAITNEAFAPVEAVPVSKSYACTQIRAGGGPEGGHRRDEWYSSYDRRQRLDPCGH